MGSHAERTRHGGNDDATVRVMMKKERIQRWTRLQVKEKPKQPALILPIRNSFPVPG